MNEIITAVQDGSQDYVYWQGQRRRWGIFAGNGPHDGLKDFTSSPVSVRRAVNIYVFGVHRRQISGVFAT